MVLKANPLSEEAFAPYGRFFSVSACDATPDAPLVYCADVDTVTLNNAVAGIGVLHVDPQQACMQQMELHVNTEECWIVLDGECTACFGTPCDDPNDAVYEAFSIPAKTVVILKSRVWHYAPIACGQARTAVLALLPPNTPQIDILVLPLKESITIA